MPPFGGFTLTYLRIELTRRLRNRRTLFFTIAFPVVMYVIIGIPLRDEPCIVALDGEREIELFRPGHGLEIVFNPNGPNVVNIPAAIRAGAIAGAFND